MSPELCIGCSRTDPVTLCDHCLHNLSGHVMMPTCYFRRQCSRRQHTFFR
jgi:hypothetical protein